ncbi:MAG TPA: right-handed parallel beta-helix repeat-containing protein [Armatimonadota bacterium]|nr:right-handed parallel beta-helix repeat-containing protein [Armatimonadota bacterium]
MPSLHIKPESFLSLIITIISVIMMTSCPLPAAQQPDAGKEFDLQGYIDKALQNGEKCIVIPKGRYRVKPHNRVHLILRNVQDTQIIANGVEMICTETTQAILFDNCRNVLVRGLTIDYDPLPFTQGRITGISDDTMTHDIELFEGYPPAQTAITNKYEIFDPKTRTLRYGEYYLKSVEALDARHLRVTKRDNFKGSTNTPERIGDIVAINSVNAPGGSSPHAIISNQCTNLRLENITLYASNCFGFFETNCNNTTYLRCKVDRCPIDKDLHQRADARIRSLDADAFHSKFAVKGPSLINCVARFQGDDCLNICGAYHMITACAGNTVRVLANGNSLIKSGDPVELLRYDGMRLPDANVISVVPDGKITDAEKAFLLKQRMNDNYRVNWNADAYTVTLDRDVELPMGSLICSAKHIGNGFLVKGCDFGYNRSRGILIKASDGQVINNTLTENWGEAIKVSPEYWWLEAGSSNNVIVAGNTVKNCKTMAIAVYAHGANETLAPSGAHNNITVADNTITGSPLPNIMVTSTDGLKITGNTCMPSTTIQITPWTMHLFQLTPDTLTPIMTTNCTNVTQKANHIK